MGSRKIALKVSLFISSLLFAHQVLAQTETEPNDTMQTADFVARTISGTLSSGDDEDWYVFSASRNGVHSFNFSAPAADGSYSWRITIRDNSGSILNDVGSGGDIELISNATLGESYFIQIRRGLSFDSSEYSLNIMDDTSVIVETEPNDDQHSAENINDFVAGKLQSSEDEDWYTFIAENSGTYSVSFSVAGVIYNNHWNVSVLDSSGNVLAGGSVGENLLLSTGLDAGSTYFIRVHQGLAIANTSQYQISITSGSSQTAETEPNNNQLDADTLVDGLIGNLSSVVDEDWYEYTSTTSENLGIAFEVDENSTYHYWNVSIVDSNGTILTAGDTGRSLELLARTFPGEIYYVRVKQGSSGVGNATPYSLELYTIEGAIVESELNDDRQSANTLINGISGNLSTEDDQDWFVFTANTSGTINLSYLVEEGERPNIWSISILDSNETILSGGETGDDLELVAGVHEGNVYYVRIQKGSHFEISPSRYTLTISTDSNFNFESESNDTQQAANALVDGIAGNLSSESDQDWYSFSAPVSGSVGLVFDVDEENSLARWHVSILNEDGIVQTASFADPGLELYTSLIQGNNYYVQVTSAGSASVSVQYTLEIVTNPSLNFETEINDEQELANEFIDEIAGNLSSAQDLDWYSFSAQHSGSMEIAFETANDSFHFPWLVSIIDSEGNLLAAREFDRSFELVTGVSEGNLYYISINKGSNTLVSTDQYLIRLSTNTNIVSEMEPNNERLLANRFVDGITGSLSTDSDEDWFEFTATETGTHTLEFSNLESFFNTEWSIAILGSDGNFITGGTAGSNNTINKYSTSLSAGENYYVQVQYSNGVIYPNLYSLTIEYDPDLIAETSDNDTLESADTLTKGMVGNISNDSDEDWYVLFVDTPSTLEINFFVDENILRRYWNVSIWDSNGELLTETDANGNSKLSKFIPDIGNVFIRVSPGEHFFNSAQYSLSYSFRLAIVESGTAALVQLGQCASETICIEDPLTYIDQLFASDPGVSGVSELSLFDKDFQVESATLAGFSGSSFTPYLESFAYTNGPNFLLMDSTALQSYRFEETGDITVSASLTHSQTGSNGLQNGAPAGMAAVTLWAFRMNSDPLDLTHCNLIADEELTLDVGAFSFCILTRGQILSGNRVVEIEGFELLRFEQFMDEPGIFFLGREYPEVLNQQLEKEFEIQGVAGDVFYLIAHSSTLVHSGGSAEINNFSLEIRSNGEDPIVLPAYTQDSRSPLPSRSIATVSHVANNTLAVPLIQVGDRFFSADFSLVTESETLQLQLISAREVFNVDGLTRGTFDEDLLTIPSISFAGELYSAVFRFVDEELLRFELVDYHQE